jgi:serine/threonine protein kinase
MSSPAFPGYRVLDAIGTGGMAELFLVERTTAEGARRRVVIKRILPAFARDPHFRQLFVHEARVALQLTHANIVQVYDFRESNDTYLLEMEYVEGCDLRRLLSDGPLSLSTALYVGAELARGLDYAHRRRGEDGIPLEIVHRDVAPGNILVSREGEVKLTDFGLARSREKLERSVAGIKGTFAFMSPEQAEGIPVDARADVFAVGAVLYATLTGHSPFEADGPLTTLERVRAAHVEPSGAPPPIECILQRAMAREREHRFAGAAGLREAIEAAAAELGIRLSPDGLGSRVCVLAARVPERAAPVASSPAASVSKLSAVPRPPRLGTQRMPSHRSRHRRSWIVGVGAVAAVAIGFGRHRSHPVAAPASPVVATPTRVEKVAPPVPVAADSVAPGLVAATPSVHAPARPRSAFLTVNADPWAYVRVDGKRRGTTPLMNIAVAPGTHEVTLENPALGSSRARIVELGAGEHQTVVEKLTP